MNRYVYRTPRWVAPSVISGAGISIGASLLSAASMIGPVVLVLLVSIGVLLMLVPTCIAYALARRAVVRRINGLERMVEDLNADPEKAGA